jgi:hypothetical protein
MTLDHSQASRTAIILLLCITLLLSLWWLVGWVVRFAHESLQLDLAVFYTAGEALNHGLSPYRNHVARDPPIWDGVAYFEYSRFLYPPHVAVFFRPLAWLPYAAAKRLWMALTLTAVAASLALTGRVYGLRRRWVLILITAIGAALFYPLLTHLERGQIDALTLLLIVLASAGLGKRTPRAGFGAGALLCMATLLKLHCVYMLPILAIRKKGWTLLGYLAGGALIAVLTVVTPGGIEATLGYARDELPRISRYGEGGKAEMLIPEEILRARLRGLPEGTTIKDGVVYKQESFGFYPNGTLVRILQRPLQRANIWVSPSLISALVLAGQVAAMLVWQLRQPQALRFDALGEFLYWQVVALIVLLSAPLTWVMNLVWLLPLIVAILSGFAHPASIRERPTLILSAVALVVIALPSDNRVSWMAPVLVNLVRDKYVIGQLLLLFSLLGYLSHVHGNLGDGTRQASIL